MDLYNRLLILLFPNAYVKFRVVCGWLQEILGGFGWFRVVCCFSSYLHEHALPKSISFIVECFDPMIVLCR